MIKKLKNKKAKDLEGWKNEYIKMAGKDLKDSMLRMYNTIIKSKKIPTQWKRMKIKSIYKKKGDRKNMKYQRGLFLTNIVSKTFERILQDRNKITLREGITEHQCGGISERGTRDSLFILQGIIDYNKYLGSELYVILATAEKCFDKLWLNDACNEMYNIGVEVSEVETIRRMNTNVTATVETPFGNAEEVNIKEAVRLGSVSGRRLCAIETDKVNSINEKAITTLGPQLQIESLIFVDDIMGAGSKACIEKVGRNLVALEKRKKFTFNQKNPR